jgi:formylglycine-generating enzyme required for sulfatase activity
VCIGIDDYAATAIDDLSYAEADAREVAALLRGHYGFGSVRELLGVEATRQGIVDAVSELFDNQRVSRDDAVVVYFSGHGQTIDTPRGGQMGFLIPQDARIDMSQATESGPYYKSCIAMEDVRKWRQLIPARHVLFVADSCYSGLLGVEKSMPRPIGDALSLEVCQILTAGTRGQKVPESSNVGHGAFTAKLLEALRTRAADLNKDGYIRASELGQYLKDCNLPGQSPQSKVMDGEGDFILWPRGGEVFAPVPAGSGELDRIARLAELSKAAESAFAKAEQVDVSALSALEKAKAWELAELACVPAGYRVSQIRSRIAHWKESASRGDYTEDGGVGLGLRMVWVKPDSFRMGSPESEEGRYSDEGPVHDVTLDGFWLGKHEVTQAQYEAVTGKNPSHFKGASLPVETVRWDDAMDFCRRLSQRTGKTYTLPSEAQWEYACRAGSQTRFCFGDSDSGLDAYAWYSGNSGSKTHPVGEKSPNAWGLHDMHGNVWEWCSDWDGPYSSGSVRNPTGPSDGSDRVLRGGGWGGSPQGCRSAYRYGYTPGDSYVFLGFRVLAVPAAGR